MEEVEKQGGRKKKVERLSTDRQSIVKRLVAYSRSIVDCSSRCLLLFCWMEVDNWIGNGTDRETKS